MPHGLAIVQAANQTINPEHKNKRPPFDVSRRWVPAKIMTNYDLPTTRRKFLKTSAAASVILSAPAIFSGNLFAAENSDTLRVGQIGRAHV